MSKLDWDVFERDLMALLEDAQTLADLESARLRVLGRKGCLTQQMKALGSLSPDERRRVGSRLNGFKALFLSTLEQKRSAFDHLALPPPEDTSLMHRPASFQQGRIHPITQVVDEIVAIYASLGFNVAEGPDIETNYYNFTALNFPKDHPARDMHDTFFFNEKEHSERLLLRTHTSTVQIRTMQSQKPPIRIIAPGRTYRCDSDPTHTPMFHQVEGLVIDKSSHFGHMKWLHEEFLKAFFEVDGVKLRFRPSFFPFTEPSMEVDVRCQFLGNEVRIGEGDDWLEILGCGMVHPNVLRECDLDPETYQGFAWGMGIDRVAMLKYGMPDLRDFFNSDMRWITHYGFAPLDIPTLYGGLSC